jgi:putative ABC transport system ATP-binding protein
VSTRRRRSGDQHEGAYALEMADVTKVYEVGGMELVALDHVDLAVDYNEVVTLLGPSGSGKTTLLSIAGGLLTATTGSVVVDGRDITRASARKLTAFRRRQVGFIFQAVNLVPFLTARENLLVVAELAGRERGKAKRRADQLLDELGLARRMGNLPSQLSGGERQRVAIGRALMNEPALVLVDEPTSALDSDLGQQVMELIVSEVKARGAAAVIVTHDVRMTRYGDRVLTMADGRIAEMASRSEWITSRRAERDGPSVPATMPAAQAMGQPHAAALRPAAGGAALPPPRPSTRRPPQTSPPPPRPPASPPSQSPSRSLPAAGGWGDEYARPPAAGGPPGVPGAPGQAGPPGVWGEGAPSGAPDPRDRGPEWGDFGPLTPGSTPRVDPADVARAAMTGSHQAAAPGPAPSDARPPGPTGRMAPPAAPAAFHAPVTRPGPGGPRRGEPPAGPGGPRRGGPPAGPGGARRGGPPAGPGSAPAGRVRGPARRPTSPAGPARPPDPVQGPGGGGSRPEFSASSGGGPDERRRRPGGRPRTGDVPAARPRRPGSDDEGGYGRVPEERPGAGDESVRPYMVGGKSPLPKRRPGRARYPGNDDQGRTPGPATGPHAGPPTGSTTWDRGSGAMPAGDPTSGRSPLPRREPGLGYVGGPYEAETPGGARPPLPRRTPGPGGHPGQPGPASGGRRGPAPPRRRVTGPPAAQGAGEAPPRRRPPPGSGPGPGPGGPQGPPPGYGGPRPDGYPGPRPERGPVPGEPAPARRPTSSLPEPPDEIPGWGDEASRPEPRRRRRGDDEPDDGFWPERWRD